MHECANLFSLIRKVRVHSDAGSPGPERVVHQLRNLGLSTTGSAGISGAVSEHPILFVDRDRRNLVEKLRDTNVDEFLVVDADDHSKATLSVPFVRDGVSRFNHELDFEEGVSGLCQCFLQRTAQHQQSERHYVIGQNLVGVADSFQATLDLTMRVASLDVGVYVNGETGTGKELIARSIHYMSDRRDRPFVPVNCGAFNDELILSELFGHAKGSFTGAEKNRTGLIEQAEGGTLFLDEIDCLSTKAQIILLRFLQENEYRPVGSNSVKTADVRVVAASNSALEELVRRRHFREDLLYRLDILRINVPALRDRGADRQLLSQLFLRRLSREHSISPRVLDSSLIAAIDRYSWPGNIRQLENSLYRFFLLTDGFLIRHNQNFGLHDGDSVCEFPAPTGRRRDFQTEKADVIRKFENSYLRDVLTRANGNVSQAARLARKERTAFIRLMRKYGLNREHFVTASQGQE